MKANKINQASDTKILANGALTFSYVFTIYMHQSGGVVLRVSALGEGDRPRSPVGTYQLHIIKLKLWFLSLAPMVTGIE